MRTQLYNALSSVLNLVYAHVLAPVISVLFPSDCPVCLEPLGRYHVKGICLDCWISIKVIKKPFCLKCGLPLDETVMKAKEESICTRCRRKNYHFAFARSPAEYSGTFREILRLYKFGKNEHLAVPLSGILMQVVGSEMFSEDRTIDADAIIAVPLHRKREKRRGFNQSYLIARLTGKKLRIKVEKRILVRSKDCIPQSELPPDKREKNVRGAFAVRNARRIGGKKILLIDDIFTTGATVSECSKALKQAGAGEVVVFTVAHTPLPLH